MIDGVGPKSVRPSSAPPSAPKSALPPSSRSLGGGPRSSGPFEIYGADSNYCIGRYEGVLICVWRDAPTLAALETVRRAFVAMVEERPAGVGVVGLAQEGMPTMGSVERQMASALFGDLGRRAYYVATVIEGDGFWASTSRSVMTAISIVAHRPCPLRIFRHTAEAAEWQTRFPGGASVSLLCEAIERCRAEMTAG
jgi:hypothetical protein